MKNTYFIIVFLFFFFADLSRIKGQEIPVHISATEVYNFIDELGNEKMVSLQSCIKPYTRKDVIAYLLVADSLRANLSERQKKDLDGYLFEFTGKNNQKPNKNGPIWKILPPEFLYYSRKTGIIIRPLYDYDFSFYQNGKPFYQSGGGAELLFYKGIVSGYANLTDHYFNREILVKPGYLISGLGGNYKVNEGGRAGGDYSEMRGGLFINWKWGRIGFVKDHVEWGDNKFGGLIFSGQAPSFPLLTLHAQLFKWFTLDYLHGWLVSEVIDSNSSYYSKPGTFRGVYQPKYIASNMFTFRPWKYFNVSIGNSIIYSDVPVQVVYLIPFLFYKSVDHTINHNIDNQNSQLFLNISSRNVKHLHLYGSLFIDEFSIKRITDPGRYNFFGYKLGACLSNWPIKNLALDLESTIIYPMVYKHRVASLTYASNEYNLGYFLGANSMDFHVKLRYNPLTYLYAEVHYEYAVHGGDYEYILNKNIDKHPLISYKVWDRHLLSARITYRPAIGLRVFAEGLYSNMSGYEADGYSANDYLSMFSPGVFRGRNLYLNLGVHLGL